MAFACVAGMSLVAEKPNVATVGVNIAGGALHSASVDVSAAAAESAVVEAVSIAADPSEPVGGLGGIIIDRSGDCAIVSALLLLASTKKHNHMNSVQSY